jgi:AdoMet-dependent rRNA methyltransferase SPB1
MSLSRNNKQNFFPGSIILGIDLLPIRAIRNVKTIVADITSQECRKLIANELQTWKADVVLCDGAPNVISIMKFP